MNRSLAATAALAAFALAPAFAAADVTGGIAGTVIDGATGKPIPGAAVIIARLPESTNPHASAVADRHGFFADLGLEPGRYAVTASLLGRSATCIIDDVFGGVTRRVRIFVERTPAETRCVGPTARRDVVDPDQLADVYRIR